MPARNGNKRVRSTKATQNGRSVLDEQPHRDPSAALRMKERALKMKMHRMRVEMVANKIGFPIGKQSHMSLAQAASKRRSFLVHACEFVVTAILIGGACAWLYQWWLTRQ